MWLCYAKLEQQQIKVGPNLKVSRFEGLLSQMQLREAQGHTMRGLKHFTCECQPKTATRLVQDALATFIDLLLSGR